MLISKKGFPIGGHIHYSTRPNSRMLRAFDNYMSISLLILEKPIPAMNRRKKYGRLGDFRTKDHGGFEYRTPASWLMSEDIALGVVTLGYIIAVSYPILTKNFLDTALARAAYYRCDKNYFRPIVKLLWEDLRACPAYNHNYKYIRKLESMIMNNQVWQESVDLRRYWRVNIPKHMCNRL